MACRVVRQRGRFMQEACEATRGGMAAVIGLDEEPTRRGCAEAGVVLANLNCPGQIVHFRRVRTKSTKAVELAKAKGRQARHCPAGGRGVSLAAHGRRATEVAGGIGQVKLLPPVVPVISNVTGQPHGKRGRTFPHG